MIAGSIISKVPNLTATTHIRSWLTRIKLGILDLIQSEISTILFKYFLKQAHAGQRPVCAWFLEIAFVRKVDMLVCVVCPQGYKINYILMIFNLYNQLNKFIAFRNVTKLSMHGRGLCKEALP